MKKILPFVSLLTFALFGCGSTSSSISSEHEISIPLSSTPIQVVSSESSSAFSSSSEVVVTYTETSYELFSNYASLKHTQLQSLPYEKYSKSRVYGSYDLDRQDVKKQGTLDVLYSYSDETGWQTNSDDYLETDLCEPYYQFSAYEIISAFSSGNFDIMESNIKYYTSSVGGLRMTGNYVTNSWFVEGKSLTSRIECDFVFNPVGVATSIKDHSDMEIINQTTDEITPMKQYLDFTIDLTENVVL